MGMSHDYQAAVEEGSTIVRVGTAIFGARRAPQLVATDPAQKASERMPLKNGASDAELAPRQNRL